MALTDISKHAETVEGFINELAEAFRKKRWIKILSLIGIAFALLLNPTSVEYGVKFLNFRKPDWYSYLVWGIITGIFFVAAFFIAVLSKKEEKIAPLPPISIIKGLYPYTNTKEDADWFARLQRGNILQDCLRLCAGEDSFAILSGDSGAGKTSFLQAGLCPNLERQGLRPIYVKLTDNSPLDSICQALNRDSENPISDDQHSLLECLRKATQVDAHPIVVILDQFEQFFTHNKSKASRKLFIQQMAEWYKQSRSLPVKILISIRGDFENRLNEFRREMKYALPPQNNLSLEKFEPQEAAQVISVIAGEAKIELDAGFVDQLTKYELADGEGTVSPVDIQILSLMIERRKSSEERAFDLKAFQKLGGVEGLLERFLNKVIVARGTDARRQTAIKVMLALTEQNVRVGALSLRDLKEKLRGDISAGEVEETVSWLARGDVRLIMAIQEKNIILYELAHERIIPPLRRLAFREITDIERAQQALDRRVNEWIGNNRARRYLLTFREWRKIKRYLTVVTSGTQKEQKKEFISRSSRRFMIMGSSYAIISILGFGVYIGYEMWWRRPETQMHYAQKRLVELSNRNKGIQATSDASLLLPFLEAAEEQELSKELWVRLTALRHREKTYAIEHLAAAYGKMPRTNKVEAGLNRVRQIADGILQEVRDNRPEEDSKVGTLLILESLAKVYSNLPETSEISLNKVLEATNEALRQEGAYGMQERTYSSLAEAYGQLSKPEEAIKGLNKILEGMKISRLPPTEQAKILHSLAKAYDRLPRTNEVEAAQNRVRHATDNVLQLLIEYRLDNGMHSYLKGYALEVLVKTYGKLPTTNEVRIGLNRIWRMTNNLLDEADRMPKIVEADGLTSLARVYSELPETDKAVGGLDKVLERAGSLTTPNEQADLLGSLAELYGKLPMTREVEDRLDRLRQKADALLQSKNLTSSTESYAAARLIRVYSELPEAEKALKLDEILEISKRLEPAAQTEVLKELTEAYGELSETDKAVNGLDKVQMVTAKIDPAAQIIVLIPLANEYTKVSRNEKAVRVLTEAQHAANELTSDDRYSNSRSSTLTKVAVLYARLHRWKESSDAARSIGNEVVEMEALTAILIIWKMRGSMQNNKDPLKEIFSDHRASLFKRRAVSSSI